jgi:hypothetical protein
MRYDVIYNLKIFNSPNIMCNILQSCFSNLVHIKRIGHLLAFHGFVGYFYDFIQYLIYSFPVIATIYRFVKKVLVYAQFFSKYV